MIDGAISAGRSPLSNVCACTRNFESNRKPVFLLCVEIRSLGESVEREERVFLVKERLRAYTRHRFFLADKTTWIKCVAAMCSFSGKANFYSPSASFSAQIQEANPRSLSDCVVARPCLAARSCVLWRVLVFPLLLISTFLALSNAGTS